MPELCETCHRKNYCLIRNYAAQTLPWLQEIEFPPDMNNFMRGHLLARVMRGNSHSPGFLEDMEFEGYLSKTESAKKVQRVLSQGPKMEILVEGCRGYIGLGPR